MKSAAKHFSLRGLSVFMLILAVVMSGLIIWTTHQTSASFERLKSATDEYIIAQQDISSMKAASDYLTSQARAYVVTGDSAYIDAFYEEIHVTRRRDTALESLQAFHGDTESFRYLKEALEASNYLVNIENYAMRLAALSFGLEEEKLPEEVRQVTLTPEHLSLNAEAQADTAVEMMFGEDYQKQKDIMNDNISKCAQTLIEETSRTQEASSQDMLDLLARERTFIFSFLAFLVFISVILFYWVIRPIYRINARMNQQTSAPEVGVKEVMNLARSYNDLHLKNLESQEQLSYEASHDALTGVYNRGVFEKVREQENNFGLILVDVDRFKNINDTYGHDAGDKILKTVADQLMHHFRSNDYVCRIGGDEFAVIMVHAGNGMKELVRDKFNDIQYTLSHPEGSLPVVTLSVGAAFSDRPHPREDIFKDADRELYTVKNSGGGGIRFCE